VDGAEEVFSEQLGGAEPRETSWRRAVLAGAPERNGEMTSPSDVLRSGDTLLALAQVLPTPLLDLLTATSKEQFDRAFSEIVSGAIEQIERDSYNLNKLCENALSGEVVRSINGTLILQLTREESSNGHVDLTFHAPLCRPPKRVLGEAKIFNYYRWHKDGLTQLVSRYSTGREERGLLLVFVKTDRIKDRMETLRAELDEKRPCEQTAACANHCVRWSFVTTHEHTSNEHVEVWHLGCNLFSPAPPLSL
jgi:hypothetical protein